MIESAASARSRGSIAVEASLVGGAGVIDQLSRFALAVIAAGVLGPIAFGSWSLIAVIIQYANILSLGVSTGAARSVPVLRGTGDDVQALKVEGTTRTAGTATSVLAGVVGGLIVAAVLPGPFDLRLPILVGGAIVAQQQVVLDQSLLRSRFAFRRAGAEALGQGVSGLVVGLLLLPLGIAGLAASRLVAGVVALAIGWPVRGHLAPPLVDRAIAADLIRQGFPLVVAGTMFGLLITIDRWLTLAFFGERALGQFSLASVVFAGLLMIPTLISQQHLARTGYQFGREGDLLALRHRALLQGALAVAITAPAALLAVVAAFLVIPRWLPAYEPALTPMGIAALGAVGYSITSGFPNVLGILRQGRRLLIIQAVALVVLVSIATATARLGLGLPGIAVATAISLCGYGFACVISTATIRSDPALASSDA